MEAEAGEGTTLSYKLYNTKRELQSVRFLTDQPNSLRFVSVAAVATEATDKLNSRMQMLDLERGGMHELLSGSMITECQRGLCNLVAPPLVAGPHRSSWQVSMLIHHFSWYTPALVDDGLAELARAAAMISSCVWARMEVPLASWPWRMLSSASSNLHELWSEHGCCLDSWFSEPLRRAFPSQESLAESREDLRWRWVWVWYGRVCGSVRRKKTLAVFTIAFCWNPCFVAALSKFELM